MSTKKGYKSVKGYFKKYEEIPEEWNVVPLNKYTTIKDGDWILEENYSERGVRLLQIGDIGLGYFLDKSQKYISKKTSNELKCTIIEQGKDILISRMPTPIGRACISPILPYPYIVAVDISILKNNLKKIDQTYLVYTLNHSKNLNNVQKYVAGTTRQRINRKNLETILIILPSLPEQQQIASILSNVDSLIESTSKIIENSKSLKTGLMQKLLTRGISHTKFKKVPWLFGKEIEIPEDWEVKELETLVDILDSKRIPLEVSERKKRIGKYPYYGASGIIDYVNDYIFDERILCLSEDGENLKSRVLPIAFTVEEKCWVNNHAHVLKMKKNVEHYFIEKVLNHISLLKYVASTAIPKLNQRDMCTIPILLPPLPEQQKIASILSNIDAQIDSQTQYKDKLERLKKSLMQ